jgi:predicted membrane protein (TIGR00267 family)
MRVRPPRPFESGLLPFALGLSDGILNALVLASGALLRAREAVTVLLGVRVGVAALATAAFAVYVAKYADLRGQLARASRQLNLASRGYLAATQLGRHAAREAFLAMVIASAASFVGALLPLAAGALLPGPPWLPVAIAVAALAGLGGALGRVVGGNPARWAIVLTVGGIAVAIVGVQIHIA